MARSAAFAVAILDHRLVMARVAGILCLGLAILLEAVVVTPFSPLPRVMITPLLFVAVVQIGAGLNEWRHERALIAVVLVSFGLFSFSQISYLGHASVMVGGNLAQGIFLLFWGLFAALIAAQPSDCGHLFHLLLTAVATTLLLKAVVIIFAWTAFWALPLLAGVVTFSLATLAGLRHLPALRS